jgi:hypothetical protein
LPKGKNPYKNVINLLIIRDILWGVNESEMEMKNRKMKEIGKTEEKGISIIRGDYFSEEGGCLSWTVNCQKSMPGHENCQTLTAADIDPVLTREGELGGMPIGNMLKGLLTVFVLRDGTAKSISSAQSLAKTVLNAEEDMELVIFSGAKMDNVNASKFPSQEDFERAIMLWIGNCEVGKSQLEKTGFGPIKIKPPIGLLALPEAEKKGWEQAMKNVNWTIEKVRGKLIHKKEKLVESKRVFIGDSSAQLLAKELPQTVWIGQEGPVALTIRSMANVILSSKVKVAIIMIGRDSLCAGESVTLILEQIHRLLAIVNQFKTKIYWLPCAYIHSKPEEWEELLGGINNLLTGSAIQLVCTTPSGRSLIEVFRYGNRNNKPVVSEEGVITTYGVHMIRAWIFSQIPKTGNDELGIPNPILPGRKVSESEEGSVLYVRIPQEKVRVEAVRVDRQQQARQRSRSPHYREPRNVDQHHHQNPHYREPRNVDHHRQNPNYREPRNGDRRPFGVDNQRRERFGGHRPYIQSLNREPRSTRRQ